MSVCGSFGMSWFRACGSSGLPWVGVSGVVFWHKFNTLRKPHRFSKVNGVGLLLFLLYLLALPEEVEPYVRSAHEGRFPHVWDTASLRPVIWVRGSMLQHVLGSSAVRVTDNRIRFIPAAWTLITVGSYATESTSCTPHASALCRVSGSELRETLGMGIGSLVFPIDGMGVRVHGNTSHSCKNGKGRISEASDMVEPVYDISVCDVVDGPLDILFIYNRVRCVRCPTRNQSPFYMNLKHFVPNN